MYKIVVASDSFKGTLSSLDICNLFIDKLSNKVDHLVCLPIADGGEGSLESISSVIKGKYIEVTVKDLYFNDIKTKYFISNDNKAYIESASVVGLSLAKLDNDPSKVTTFGIGELIKDAINKGIKDIYVFIGGTATNDGGVGLASALGTTFINKNGQSFIPVGLTLKDIESIDNKDASILLKDINITVLSDVSSPFYGSEGAAYKFAKQKGASDEEIKLLDDGLRHLSNIINRDLSLDISLSPGAGAAGGLGGGLLAFANAKIESGISELLNIIDFENKIKDADLVVSGEGKLDKQTLDGKTIDGVAKICMRHNVPLCLIVGTSSLSLKEIQSKYPCVKYLFETNYKHLPFDEIKSRAKEDYINQIDELIKVL